MPGTMFPFDELNKLKEKWSASALTKADKDWIYDDLIDLFTLAYTYGCEQVMNDIAGAVAYFGGADEAIFTEVAGKKWDERLDDILKDEPQPTGAGGGTSPSESGGASSGKYPSDKIVDVESSEKRPKLPDLTRLADTEAHRIYCAGADDTAVRSGATTKTWVTMEDSKVRESHSYLDRVTAPIDGVFTTFDGDSAKYPGDFSSPENNINCRCYLEYSK